MAKKTSFGPDFGPFGPKFFCGFYLFYMLDIFASYYCVQFKGKLMNRTWENGKFMPFFFWLRQSLDIMVSYNMYNIRKN